MHRTSIAVLVLVTACEGSVPIAPDAGSPVADGGRDAGREAVDASPARDTGAPDAGDGYVVDGSCEGRYWRHWVGVNNEGYEEIDRLAYTSLAYIRSYVEDIDAAGGAVTLGGTLALLLWEGGAKVAWVNDACSENSYVREAGCWNSPQARYSYQLGMGGIHTSNFYPCRDVGWTSRMRARFSDAMTAHGFSVTDEELASVAADLETVCPGLAPEPIDYYILAIHRDFGVPTDTHANDIEHIGAFPFFTPEISIDLAFGELTADPASLTDDRALITRFGGADGRYADPAYQDRILESWASWRATECAGP